MPVSNDRGGVMIESTEALPFPDRRFPLVVRPEGGHGPDLAQFAEAHEERIRAELLEHGALLFRGFGVRDVDGFDRFVAAISTDRNEYVYRSTPRTALGNGIYTATEYPAGLEIPLHNENAYQRSWPLRLAFCCVIPSASGGETPLADMRRVSAAIGPRVLDAFESRGVRYIRNYRPYVDLSWQVVFQTDDRDAVARFCEANGITYEWIGAETLRTTQVCQGTARHPVTGERVFFNQAHLFHVAALGDADAEVMLEIYGKDGLPRHACYGDGGEIEPDVLATITAAFRDEAVALPWQAGDVMLIDNMQIAHGRRPFTGERRVLASLLDAGGAAGHD